MSIIDAIILGLIQGLTEFIPVSSSGHLVLLHEALGVTGNTLAFDVALHVGTLVALLLFFRQDVVEYAKSIFVKSEKTRLAWLLLAATVPAAAAGFLFEDLIENVFRATAVVAINLIVFGLLMLAAEFYYRRRSTHAKLAQTSTKQGLGVGFAQMLALVPGVSRSGSTITAGMFLGLERVAATKFSFLLGIPIIAGAALATMLDPEVLRQMGDESTVFIVGVISAFISGLFAIRFMLKFLSSNGLELFAFYRIGLGIVVLAFAWIM